jgi:hypothetical protein
MAFKFPALLETIEMLTELNSMLFVEILERVGELAEKGKETTEKN